MTLLLKDPDAVLDYLIDWSSDYLESDEIVESNWIVTPQEPLGVTIQDAAFTAGTSTVTAGGGIAGRLYQLTNDVLLESGRRDRRSVTLRVEKR